ncbi:MAG: CotH kinase family protein [Saprospiraceae bacterium]
MFRFLPIALLLTVHCAFAQSVNFQSSNLPIVVLNTAGQTIPENQKITAGMSIIANGPGQINHLTDPPNAYNGLIGIELRGSFSLQYAKKNFSIETRDLAGGDLSVPLLDMPSESDWALISPLNDKSLIRDALAYWLATRAMDWAPRTRFVEVVLNGEYIGVYLLLETVKRDGDRVDIAKLKDSDLAGDSLTGGYILAMDKDNGNVGGDWPSAYPPFVGAWQTTWFQVVYPKSDDIQPEQRTYIEGYMNDFEQMLAQWTPNTTPAYADWIDVESWASYLLVNEVTKNTDAYRLSAYFYKDRDDNNPLLKMGPVWDFNIAFGIGDYCEGQYFEGWSKDFNEFCPDDPWVIHFWWKKLLRDAAFQAQIKDRWQTLRAGPWSDAEVSACIDSLTDLLAEPAARNFQRWPVLGQYIIPNAFVGQTWQQEIDYLDTWLGNRIAWMDGNIMSIGPAVSVDNGPGPALLAVYPNPLPSGHALTVEYDAVGEAQFALFDLAGRRATPDVVLPGGLAQRQTVTLPAVLPPGLYFYTIWQGGRLIGRGKLATGE